MTAEWELQQYASAETAGELCTAISAGANAAVRHRTMGDQTRTPGVRNENGDTADTQNDESSCLQRLTCSHSTNGTPETRARAPSRQAE